MKRILSRFPKTEIGNLPRVCFEGRIITVQSEEEAEKAVDYLLSRSILGFDTETKPNFTSGHLNAVALLQVCDGETCVLFRLNQIGLPDSVVRLLTDRKVLKIGLSWHDDLRMLHHRREFEPGTFVELQTMAAEYGIKDMSLQKLYANIFGQKISKSQQLSNWETDVLKEQQKLYAATDAWACVMLYQELVRLKKEGFELEIVPEPEPPQPKQTSEKKEHKEHKADKPKEKKTEKPKEQKAALKKKRKPYKRKPSAAKKAKDGAEATNTEKQ